MVALPVYQESAEDKYLRLYRHGLSLWCAHVAEEMAFGLAAAYAQKSMASVPEANCVIGELADADVSGVQQYFENAGTTPRVWHFPGAAADAAFAALRPRPMTLLRLQEMPVDLPQTHAEVTIIPARAGLPQVQQMAAAMHPAAIPEQAAEAEMCHLDDARVDALLALQEGRPVGYASVLSLGDAGLVTNLFVAPELRGRGIGRALGGRVLDICSRSLFHDVLLAVPQEQAASAFVRGLGFAPAATALRRECGQGQGA